MPEGYSLLRDRFRQSNFSTRLQLYGLPASDGVKAE